MNEAAGELIKVPFIIQEIMPLKRPVNDADTHTHTKRKRCSILRNPVPELTNSKPSEHLARKTHPAQMKSPVTPHKPEVFGFSIKYGLCQPYHRNQEHDSESHEALNTDAWTIAFSEFAAVFVLVLLKKRVDSLDVCFVVNQHYVDLWSGILFFVFYHEQIFLLFFASLGGQDETLLES